MIKLEFDHQTFSLQKYGGISRYFCDLLRGINLYYSEEFDASIEAYFSSNMYLHDINQTVNFGIDSPKLQFVLNEILYKISTPVFKPKPDIIHSTYFYEGFKRSSKNSVMTFYDCIPERYPEYFNSEKVFAQKKKAIEKQDLIIAISRSTANDIMEIYGVPNDRIRVVHLSAPKLVKSGKKHVAGDYILFVGHRGRYKNFDKFLLAVSRSSYIKDNYKVVCFGGGAFTSDEKLRFKALGFGPEDIIHAGEDDAILADLYSGSSLFVFPSLFEGFGIPLLEAFANGAKVCCSNIDAFIEVCGECAFYFDPKDVDHIMSVMERALDCQNLSLETHFETKFNMKKMTDETIYVYRELV